uniref:NEDD4-binding protein 1 n=1 Tax=Sphenodon punctatus TaxID=8508 RepID=A0A8D0G685_SPHPU
MATVGLEPKGGLGPVLDEFTAPAQKSGLLERSRSRIEGLFRVRFAVLWTLGGWNSPAPSGPVSDRIWLQLSGSKEAVRSAKDYIKGLCEPELDEREHYPKDMHCIFVGAQSLFLNYLIQDTCADITVLEIGLVSIKGGAESVVMARSHIQQFVNLFRSNESLVSDKESEVKKQFKHFVEAHADKYTMDLLILPSSLKRELLSLTHSECWETKEDVIDLTESDGEAARLLNENQTPAVTSRDGRNKAGTPVTELLKQMDTVFPDAERHFVPINGTLSVEMPPCKERQSCKRRSSDAEERLPKKQFSFENDQENTPSSHSKTPPGQVINLVSDSCSDSDEPSLYIKDGDDISEEMEYKILLNFFKSMGYSEKIVEEVIRDRGQSTEPLILLEEIAKETVNDRLSDNRVLSQNLKNKGNSNSKNNQILGPTLKETKVQKAAHFPHAQNKVEDKMHVSNCNTKITVPCNKNAPENSKVLLNCCGLSHRSKTGDIKTDGLGPSASNVDDLTTDKMQKKVDFVARGRSDQSRVSVPTETVDHQKSARSSATQNKQPVRVDQPGHCSPSQFGLNQPPSQNSNLPPNSRFTPQLPVSNLENKTVGFYSPHTDPSVTGIQRFLDSLKKPYRLELKNEPGRPHVKHIIIDGSNVAISHGLRNFFSCRGIAIAVNYFWKNGHRNITVFVPQWRTRRDSSITEQHFLTQLQDVGILSLTPARVVLGVRIAAHDDRFLLHLADKTGGVIVTNDNLREFVTESLSWREIIQRRLLQYTFVGDIFMVPDDPLGRNGPNLEVFLQDERHFRDVSPAQTVLPRGGMDSSGTFLPIPKPTNNGGQTMDRTYGGPPPTWSPVQPNVHKGPYPRTTTETAQLKEALLKIFPTSEQRQKIDQILAQHPHMRDLNALSAMVLDLG